MGLVSWMYLQPRVDVHSGTQTQYLWLTVKSRMRVLSYLGLVIWMYLDLRVDVHSRTRTRHCSLQRLSHYLLLY
ncbi:unnamed protein product [Schistosoma margrebowiei]|uniref:Uncharacterized protein n=1 Tax=Schistosoma margrebowiei TaxID=48269 RepID=A0A183LEL2_9TREM|nr:unnamed protein product [Schistosoma margrebowiei]